MVYRSITTFSRVQPSPVYCIYVHTLTKPITSRSVFPLLQNICLRWGMIVRLYALPPDVGRYDFTQHINSYAHDTLFHSLFCHLWSSSSEMWENNVPLSSYYMGTQQSSIQFTIQWRYCTSTKSVKRWHTEDCLYCALCHRWASAQNTQCYNSTHIICN